MKDDRAEFAARAHEQSAAMGRDQKLFQQSIDLIVAADKYDYSYLWTWMGLPIIQMPADIMATQEVIWSTRPTVIVETGVARGGSLVMMASLLKLIGGGRVIGVDIEIRPHNRRAIEEHELSDGITLVEGSSTDPEVVDRVRSLIRPDDKVMVVLDSDHSRRHVLEELRAYSEIVTSGCFLVVADTAAGYLREDQTPQRRSKLWYPGDEPLSAVQDFLAENSNFEVDPAVNGKLVMSSSPNGYLRRLGA